jgi:hypothetical protein
MTAALEAPVALATGMSPHTAQRALHGAYAFANTYANNTNGFDGSGRRLSCSDTTTKRRHDAALAILAIVENTLPAGDELIRRTGVTFLDVQVRAVLREIIRQGGEVAREQIRQYIMMGRLVG